MKYFAETTATARLQSAKHHPCLLLLIGISYIKPYLLVTQFHGGIDKAYTLGNAVKGELLQTDCDWLDVLNHITKALGFIHSKGWIHNDLKDNNIVLHLIDGQWKPLIVDFGKSTRIKIAIIDCRHRKKTEKVYWIAPEVIEGRCPPSISSDLFSLGRSSRMF